MIIKRLKVKNFKSFKEIEVELGNLNVLIGPNASGKSNFLNILKFLKDLADTGLDNAVSLQGGGEYIKNIYLTGADNVSIEIEFEIDDFFPKFYLGKEKITSKIKSSCYEIEIKIDDDGNNIKVIQEILDIKFNIFKILEKNETSENLEKLGDYEFIIKNINGEIKTERKLNASRVKEKKIIFSLLFSDRFEKEYNLKENELIVNTFPFIDFLLPKDTFMNLSFYDINPKPSKQFAIISGKNELESNGSNLAIVLRKILNNEEERERFSLLVQDILPFVDEVSVERLAEKYLYTSLKEIYSEEKFIPASLISDGTVNIIILILILYFEKKDMIIIEEPERNIHPYLISKLIDIMKDVATRFNKQIIISTHNPEIVKYAGIDNIYFIRRDISGFSNVTKPLNDEEIKIFLKKDIGIDELFIQNLLK